MDPIRQALRISGLSTAGLCILAVVILLTSGGVRAAEAPAGKIDFNRDIRPILSNNCFQCHGPDEKERQAGLRLDLAEAATKPAESGKMAIVPGKPDESELIARIYAADESERMPPADSNKTLSEPQKVLLKQWIAEGAARQAHWSLVALQRPPLPVVADRDRVQNEIDLFVLSRLEREGLSFSPPADRLTLIRRVYLDLLGLLPTPEEADAFVQDARPEAYDELVDRLLDSPRYGERWARRWLDLARYADTNGYEKDRPRSIWPYRDWVIRALNADMPFDRFTIQQIAGDLLPGANLDDKIATGFHRNTMVNEEGGIDVEEFRFQAMVDRVNTTAAVWLGLTVGCAQCHNHKFDPISQREYYQLFAFLNNADEPELEVPQAPITQQRAEIEAKIAELVRQRAARFDEPKFAAWASEAAKTAQPWTPIAPASALSTGHATLTVLADRSVLVTGDKPNQDTYVVELSSDLQRVTAIRLEVLPHESLPQGGPGRAPLFSEGDFMLGEFSLALVPPAPDQDPVALRLHDATHSYASEKMSAADAIDGDLDTGWSIKGRTGVASQAVFPLEHSIEAAAGVKLRVTLQQRYIHQMTIGRFRLSLTAADAPHATPLPAEVEAALVVDPQRRSVEEQETLKAYYLTIAPELADLNQPIEELRKSLPKQPTTLVMQERDPPHARVTRWAYRGEFLSPREPVEPGVPAVLHALSSDAPPGRLALAHWLVDPGNPLVGRVTMNRQWQYFFGRGLVRTSEDFGLRGEPPSHPELLDYLATEFVARRWSMKHMHRLIVTSATYRQSSHASPKLHEHDPQNILLARGPRLRVEAETVRDIALCASGLLNDAIGGPSVFPPQPAGVTDLAFGGAAWPTSQGPDRFRRGLYTHLKRTSPYAAFTTFDGPSGESCTLRRERSNTPLQALTMLNDAVFVEAAQALGRRVLQTQLADERQRVRCVFRLCLTREPNAQELDDLQQFYQAQRTRCEQNQLDAKAIAGGEADPNSVTELAAWTLVARAILNLDEFVTKE